MRIITKPAVKTHDVPRRKIYLVNVSVHTRLVFYRLSVNGYIGCIERIIVAVEHYFAVDFCVYTAGIILYAYGIVLQIDRSHCNKTDDKSQWNIERFSGFFEYCNKQKRNYKQQQQAEIPPHTCAVKSLGKNYSERQKQSEKQHRSMIEYAFSFYPHNSPLLRLIRSNRNF